MVKKAVARADVTSIVQDGDPVLRSVATEVSLSDIGSKEINRVIERMNTALEREADGVAIAAPQIGVPLRIFIVSRKAFAVEDEEAKDEKTKKVLIMPERNMVVINPKMTKLSKKRVKVPEGCLSCRWLYGDTIRHEKAAIRAYDEHGKAFTYGGAALIAQIFQHECDHLNGILFVDHATNIEEMTPEAIAEVEAKSNRQ